MEAEIERAEDAIALAAIAEERVAYAEQRAAQAHLRAERLAARLREVGMESE